MRSPRRGCAAAIVGTPALAFLVVFAVWVRACDDAVGRREDSGARRQVELLTTLDVFDVQVDGAVAQPINVYVGHDGPHPTSSSVDGVWTAPTSAVATDVYDAILKALGDDGFAALPCGSNDGPRRETALRATLVADHPFTVKAYVTLDPNATTYLTDGSERQGPAVRVSMLFDISECALPSTLDPPHPDFRHGQRVTSTSTTSGYTSEQATAPLCSISPPRPTPDQPERDGRRHRTVRPSANRTTRPQRLPRPGVGTLGVPALLDLGVVGGTSM